MGLRARLSAASKPGDVVTHLVAIVLVAAITVALSAVSLAIGILRAEEMPPTDRPQGHSHLNY
jgi:hypothetical protein